MKNIVIHFKVTKMFEVKWINYAECVYTDIMWHMLHRQLSNIAIITECDEYILHIIW